MADQLGIYKRVIRLLGETRITSLTDNRTIRHELDELWADGVREYCLEQGYWNFATRSSEVSFDPDVAPDFGYQYGFSKPTDWRRTAAMCTEEFYQQPLLSYEDEGQHWFTDLDTIYVKYVSDDSQYGLNMGDWPETFTQAVATHMALQLAPQHTKSDKTITDLRDASRRAFVDARSKDAMNEPTKFFATSRWVASRKGYGSRLDRGNRGSLIG